MKKFTLAVATVICLFNTVVAQKDKKVEKTFYNNASLETDELSITAINIVSETGYLKFKLKIKNKTNDYIVYKPEESKFIINGKEMKCEGKPITIAPNDDDWKLSEIKGDALNAVTSFSFQMDGLSRISTSAKGNETPDFRLPLTKNDFKTGGFSVSLNNLYKQTDATNLKMNVSYNGDKVGVVFPDRAGVKMPDGNEYAAIKSKKSQPIILTKGKDDTFTLSWDKMQAKGKTMDMQFAEMFVKWNDTFLEVKPEQLKSAKMDITMDEAKTNGAKK